MPSLRAEQNREIYCIEGVVRPRKRGKCRPQQSHRLGQMRQEIEELRARNADLEATHLLPEPNMLQDLRSSLCLTAGLDRFLATLGESSSTMLFLVAGENDLACLIMKSMKTEFIVSKEHASKKTQNYKCISAMKAYPMHAVKVCTEQKSVLWQPLKFTNELDCKTAYSCTQWSRTPARSQAV